MSVCSLTFIVSFYPSEVEVSWLNPGPTFMAGCPTFGASISSFFRSHSIILASSSQDRRVSFNHIVERASHTILPLVLMHASLAIGSLFSLANSWLAFYIRASWRTWSRVGGAVPVCWSSPPTLSPNRTCAFQRIRLSI